MKICHKALLATTLSLGLIATGFAQTLTPFTANYEVKFHGINVGKSTRQLKINKKGQYTFVDHIWSTFVFTDLDSLQQTQGTYHNNLIQPTQYASTYKNGDKSKKSTAQFNLKTQQASGTYKNKPFKLKISTGIQDSLSYQLQMRINLLEHKPLSFKLVNQDEINTYTFKVVGNEMLDTPMGKLATLKLTRSNSGKNRSTTFWLAKKYNYLIVKAVHVEHGSTTTAILTGLKP
jgi:hypothetical protein